MRHAPIQLDLMEASSAPSDYTTSLLRLAEARNCLAQSYRYEIEGKSVQIGFTYSGGMTEYSAGDDADTILRCADEALDDAKRRRTTPIVTRRRSMLRGLLRRSKD